MTTRFTIAGSDYDFLTDEVIFEPGSVRGDQWVLLNDSVEQDIIGVQVPIRVAGVFEQVAGTAISAGEIWRRALTGSTVVLRPDVTRALTLTIYPDTQSPPRPWYRTRKGVAQRGQVLSFVTTRLDPSGSIMQEIAAFQASLQSQ